ncbi:mannitol dehydrogenase family protein [Pedococcus sp. NPDC057267]|uniref:mannitol dehydrogenase family protein n=1 Tax=Pedococcus sp. NPDC057267 TaxID=3346077 RepID=UPI003642DADB
MAARGGAVRRLSRAALPGHDTPGLRLPPAPELASRVGIVHLGIGAFHRAHQAVFTEDAALAADEPGWGICGVTQRSAAVVDQLRPQDHLYAVLERGASTASARVVGQVSEVLFARDQGPLLFERLADPLVRVVTLTVTEKGYRRGPDGRLDLTDPVVAADLEGGARSTVGQLVRGLQARHRASAAPVTVLPCDNLTDNGAVVRRLVLDFCAALPAAEGDAVAAYVEQQVSFPSSMVDRIVPATTDEDRAEAARLLGARDEGLVVAEPFRQWVVEDRFAAGRPAWERAGAELVDDVAPYEQLKLRMLNGTHSMLAYLGALRGHGTIARAVADDDLAAAARELMAQDVLPTLHLPAGVDAAAYGRTVLERFANPALRHTTVQVAMDGSQKLPVRLLGTVRDRLAAGAVPQWATLAVAGWMAFVARGADVHGRPLPLDDPMAARLRSAVGTGSDPVTVAEGLIGVHEVFGDDLRDSRDFRDALVGHLKELL